MSLFGNSRGIAVRDKQTGKHRQVWRDTGKVSFYAFIKFWEEAGKGCFKQKITGKGREFKVGLLVVVFLCLQAVVSV